MPNKKALLVIDMQNDYLGPKRKTMFSYDSAELTASVNRAIHRYQNDGADILYIAHILPNIATNRWFIGFSIKGSEGAKLYNGLDIVSDLYFEKNLSNTYTAKRFREYMKEKQYEEVVICGLDECGCVGKTALGAAKTGVRIVMLENCIGRRFPKERVEKMRERLKKNGVVYETLEQQR